MLVCFFFSAEIGACKLLVFNMIHMKPSFLVCLSRSKCFMHIIIITCQYFPHQCLWQWCHHHHLRDAVLCSHSAFHTGIKTVAVLTSNELKSPQINLLWILWIGNKLWNKHGRVTHTKKTQWSLEAVTSKLVLFFVVVFLKTSISVACNSGTRIWVRLQQNCSGACSIFVCVLVFEILGVHTDIAHQGWMNTVRESALKVDSGKRNL